MRVRRPTIELTRRETTTSSIRPSRMTGSLVPLASNDLLYRAQVGRADHSTPRQSARPCYCIFAAPPIIVARDGGHLDDMPKMRPFTVFKKRRGITVELTRRREFNQASPDQLSYETRSRRSRPTICSAVRSPTSLSRQIIQLPEERASIDSRIGH